MSRCLNPKKAHENRGSYARPVPSGTTLALSASTSAEAEAGEEQVACQFCKYLLEGAILGDCRIIRWIGSGAFGDVYEAEQLPPLSRRVAIKVMSIERVVDGESAEMFAREVSTIAALDHPNILPVLRAGMIEDGRSYLVMKYAAQGSLQQFCQPAPPASSFLPSTVQPQIAETPTAALAIVAAETLHIADADVDKPAPTPESEHAEGAEEADRTERREHLKQGQEREEAYPPSSHAGPHTAVVDESATILPMSLVPLTDEAATHQEAREAGAENEAQEMEQAAVTFSVVAVAGGRPESEGADVSVSPDPAQASTAIIVASLSSETSALAVVGEASFPEAEQTLRVISSEAPFAQQEVVSENQAGTSETRGGAVALPKRETQPEAAPALESEQVSTVILADCAQLVSMPTTPPLPQISGALILSPQQVLPYLEEAASALHYAHQRGLIHLDVKPANLLLDAQGRLLLADFGVSVLLEGYTHASLHYYVGTPLYTAPEQWLEQPRPASDQYALAVTCYQLLTGRPPFTGNLYSVMHGHLQAPPPPMRQFNPLFPPQVEAVIGRALAKDPNARYPDILAFARAYRDALENAASANTDTQIEQRLALVFEQHASEQPVHDKVPLPLSEVTVDSAASVLISKHSEIKADQPGTFHDWEAPGDRTRPKYGHWLRNLLLLVLALLLIGGGSLGFVRTQRPCWLGICPQILLSTNAITLTNDETQKITITNTGTDDLHWQASPYPFVPWLTLSAGSGTLEPGKTATLTLKTNADILNRSGVYTDTVDVYGGPGVATQTIEVTENVVKGLSAVSVNTSGQSFLYEQGHLQPGKQKITITNHSGHTLSWFTQYTDNNWLSVTPSQGSLDNNKSVELTATVSNPQNLPNDIYQVRFSLVGQLDNQTDVTLLQTINFSLQVSQTERVTPTIVLPTQQAQQAQISFTAQPVVASGAPGVQRSNHSMVWDPRDNQLLVFGGIDAQGNLLNDLWSYSPADNKWTNLTPVGATSASDCSGGSPAPRMDAAMVWDDVDQEALLYGGEGNNSNYLGDLWAYSPAKGAWTVLACSGNGPGPRGGAGVAWNGSQMLILDGLNADGSLADFWAYTPGSSGNWSRISATTPLGARIYPAMSWDSNDKQLYIFGGLRSSGEQLGDFYVYQPGNGWQSTKSANGVAPLARQQALSAWDSKDRVFLLMGGWQANNSTTYSALWAYSPSQNTWWQITSLRNTSSTSVIPSRLASVMVWDGTDNRAYIYAGSSGVNKTVFNDLWMLSPA